MLLKPLLRAVRDGIYRIVYRGTGRWCPVCERTSRRFAPFGSPRQAEALCPHCGALPRHRLVWLFFMRESDLFDQRPKRVLHIAPERAFTSRLRARLGSGYVTADLSDPTADVRLDVTDIQYPDETFDVVYCSHVLEHVPDDAKAMRELCRILKRSGWAVLLVPIMSDRTIEDPSVTSPRERERRFGQFDHVRAYGPDFVDRLRAAGFNVQTIEASDVVDANESPLMGLTIGAGEIFFCRRA